MKECKNPICPVAMLLESDVEIHPTGFCRTCCPTNNALDCPLCFGADWDDLDEEGDE